jgi:hypothetical protein
MGKQKHAERPSPDESPRELPMLDVVHEIGERMGRAIAVHILGGGPEFRGTPWPGLYPLDPDLDDELESVNTRPGSPEFWAAETGAEEAYRQTMAEAW